MPVWPIYFQLLHPDETDATRPIRPGSVPGPPRSAGSTQCTSMFHFSCFFELTLVVPIFLITNSNRMNRIVKLRFTLPSTKFFFHIFDLNFFFLFFLNFDSFRYLGEAMAFYFEVPFRKTSGIFPISSSSRSKLHQSSTIWVNRAAGTDFEVDFKVTYKTQLINPI